MLGTARAAVKSLPSKICAWKIKDNISRLRLDFREKLRDVVCAHQDWLDAIEAMSKLKYERMKVMSRGSRAMKVSHEELTESLVDTGAHDALTTFLAHDMSHAKHAKSEDHLGY